MLHSKHITVSAGTEETNKARTSFKVNKGVLHKVWATFPPGCAGLVHFRILLDEVSIIPVDKDAYIQGDSYTFVYEPFVEINIEPAKVTIETWSDDDLYDHVVDFQFSIIDKYWIIPANGVLTITAALKSLFDSRRAR